MIPQKIEQAVISNALFQLDDQSLIDTVLNNLDKLPSDFLKSNKDLIRRFETGSPNDLSSQKLGVHLLFGQYSDLAKLEYERINQLCNNEFEFPYVMSITQEMEWLSGGLTIEYIDQKKNPHKIHLEYPFDQKLIITHRLIGGLYLDDKLVPIRSKLENEIITNLQLSLKNRTLDEVERIIKYVNSEDYIQLAKEIGRIK